MAVVNDVMVLAEKLFPPENVCMHDFIGLMTGNRYAPVTKVLVCLDCTCDVVDEAERRGAEMIVSHHPLIFGSLQRVVDDEYAGRIILRAAGKGISVFSAHTNADCTYGGLNSYLAQLLGLDDVKGLVTINDSAALGAVGRLSKSMTLVQFAEFTGALLEDKYVKIYGKNAPVNTVALVTGAGGDVDLVYAAKNAGADCYVTGEVKHHVALLAASLRLNIIEIGHYAGEHVFIPRMAQLLQTEADKQNMKIQFTAAESEKNPAL